MRHLASALALAFTIGAGALSAQDKAIDIERSTITIHVGKSGLLSAAGHEHWVNAPVASGVLNDSQSPRIEFRVEAGKMAVKPDDKVDAKTQAEVQKNMQEMTLESARYPEISFRSTRVEKQAGGEWKVEGTLTLHGVAKPVAVVAKRDGDAYTSHAVIKQTDFGIKPVTAGAGLVKVKNELDLDFRIVARSE
jgi:polyisoprenoid-binding protein YceI